MAEVNYEQRFLNRLEANTDKANRYLMIDTVFYTTLFLIPVLGLMFFAPSRFPVFSILGFVGVGAFLLRFRRKRWDLVGMAEHIETETRHENLLKAAYVGIARSEKLGFCELLSQRAYEVVRRFRIPQPVPVRAFDAARDWMGRRWYLLLLLLIPLLLALFFLFRPTYPGMIPPGSVNGQPPKVVIKKPGRDITTSKLEEVEIEVDATDDFGLEKVSLNYSIGAQPEIEIPLKTFDAEAVAQFFKTYTLPLEELDALEPGEVIAYYAKAVDSHTNTGVSQLYFIEIRPFKDRIEKGKDNNDDGAKGSGVSKMLDELIDAQKEIIRKTWQLDQVSDSAPENFEFAVKNVGDEQNEVSEQVEKVIAEVSEAMRTASVAPEIVMNFESAQKEMNSATDRLYATDTQSALPHEKEALSSLLRAKLEMPKVMNQVRSNSPQASSELESKMDKLQKAFQNQREARNKRGSSSQSAQKQADSRGSSSGQQKQGAPQQGDSAHQRQPGSRQASGGKPQGQQKAPGQDSPRSQSASEQRGAAQQSKSGNPQGLGQSPAQKSASSGKGATPSQQGSTAPSNAPPKPGNSQGQAQKGAPPQKPDPNPIHQQMAAAQVQMNAQALLNQLEQLEKGGKGTSQTQNAPLKDLKQALKTLANTGSAPPAPGAVQNAQQQMKPFYQRLQSNQKMPGLKMSPQVRKALEQLTKNLLDRLQRLQQALIPGGKHAGTGSDVHPDTGRAPAASTAGVERYELPDIDGKPKGKGRHRDRQNTAKKPSKPLDADELRPPGALPYEYKALLKSKRN